MESFINPKEADGEQHLVIKLKISGMGLFECTSLQRQFKDKMGSKYNSNSIVMVNYNINNKNNNNNNNNNNNTNKVIIVMKKVEQSLGGAQKIVQLVS